MKAKLIKTNLVITIKSLFTEHFRFGAIEFQQG